MFKALIIQDLEKTKKICKPFSLYIYLQLKVSKDLQLRLVIQRTLQKRLGLVSERYIVNFFQFFVCLNIIY